MRNLVKDEVILLHDEVCSALADPNRILILYSLAERSMNVSELVEKLDVPQPTVCRHLRVLRDRGMVRYHRDGQQINYRLKDYRVIEALDLMRAMLADRLQNQAELLES